MADLAPVTTTPSIIPSPLLSSSKQTRILIWRTEVASASAADDLHADAQRASDASSSSATSTTASSSTSSLRPGALLSRGRQLVARLARRLSLQPGEMNRFRRGSMDRGLEPPSRTAMYAALSPENAAAWAALDAEDGQGQARPGDEAVLDDVDDEDDGGRRKGDAALREKQERLMRAARLLDQGVVSGSK